VKQRTHNSPSAGSSPALPTSPCADWMLNSYSKYAEITQEDVDWYFNNKSIDKKQKQDNIKL
jgi:hypothetical protein